MNKSFWSCFVCYKCEEVEWDGEVAPPGEWWRHPRPPGWLLRYVRDPGPARIGFVRPVVLCPGCRDMPEVEQRERYRAEANRINREISEEHGYGDEWYRDNIAKWQWVGEAFE